MIKRSLLLILTFAAFSFAHAQVKKKIKKGRRNKSESQFMLDDKYFEADWEFGHETISGDVNTSVYPNVLLRYGISKQFEVNAEINLLTAHDATASHKNSTGIEPVALGATLLLQGETNKVPAVILSGQLALPFLATKNFTANYAAPSLQITAEKAISRWILSFTNGISWDGFVIPGSYIYNGTVSYNFNQRWMLTSEWFGFINGSPPQHSTDLSINCTFNKNVQLGITGGTGLSTAAHKSYVGIMGVWGYSFKRTH